MSIDTKQIIHTASEIAVIGGITVYFMNKTNKLSEKIEELEELIQQQREIIQQHDNLILKLLNNVNALNSQNLNNIKFNNTPKNKLPTNLMSKKQVVIMIPPEPENKVEPQQLKVEEIIEIENDNNLDNNLDDDLHDDLHDDLDDELEEELRDLNDGQNDTVENKIINEKDEIHDDAEEI
jgi:hypothetical protein